MNELADFANRVSRIADGSVTRAIATKAGMAAKDAALEAASDALGGDRKFSGMRRKTALSAGYDTVSNTEVRLNLRPAGLWVLAQDGRKASGAIYPRRGNRKGATAQRGRAVMTPYGPRARSSYGPSRGPSAITNAYRQASKDVPKAAAKQFAIEVAKLAR
jgi:hypothetical protein